VSLFVVYEDSLAPATFTVYAYCEKKYREAAELSE
jgi:hypothetical protein